MPAEPGPRNLTGRVAVVTGAARGIGQAAAVALARHGAAVEQAGARWLPAVADQRDIGAVRAAAALIERELGGYGISVNAVIPGLIDTSLTRHEDRYAQAISAAGRQPSGRPEEDEARMVSGASFAVTAGDSANITA